MNIAEQLLRAEVLRLEFEAKTLADEIAGYEKNIEYANNRLKYVKEDLEFKRKEHEDWLKENSSS